MPPPLCFQVVTTQPRAGLMTKIFPMVEIHSTKQRTMGWLIIAALATTARPSASHLQRRRDRETHNHLSNAKARLIQRMWKSIYLNRAWRLLFKQLKAIKFLKEFWRLRLGVRLLRRRLAAKNCRNFFRDFSASMLFGLIQKYICSVKQCQRCIKNFVWVNRARVEVLSRCWQLAEPRIRKKISVHGEFRSSQAEVPKKAGRKGSVIGLGRRGSVQGRRGSVQRNVNRRGSVDLNDDPLAPPNKEQPTRPLALTTAVDAAPGTATPGSRSRTGKRSPRNIDHLAGTLAEVCAKFHHPFVEAGERTPNVHTKLAQSSAKRKTVFAGISSSARTRHLLALAREFREEYIALASAQYKHDMIDFQAHTQVVGMVDINDMRKILQTENADVGKLRDSASADKREPTWRPYLLLTRPKSGARLSSRIEAVIREQLELECPAKRSSGPADDTDGTNKTTALNQKGHSPVALEEHAATTSKSKTKKSMRT